MSPILKNPITLPIVFATILGILAHDTQIDQATMLALAVPATFTVFAAAESFKSNEHVHVERVSVASQGSTFRFSDPKIQPRDDDHQYVQSKKPSLLSGGSTGLWPSI